MICKKLNNLNRVYYSYTKYYYNKQIFLNASNVIRNLILFCDNTSERSKDGENEDKMDVGKIIGLINIYNND